MLMTMMKTVVVENERESFAFLRDFFEQATLKRSYGKLRILSGVRPNCGKRNFNIFGAKAIAPI